MIQEVQLPRCEYCDDTGHVHDRIGEWRGVCGCSVGKSVWAPKDQQKEHDLLNLTSSSD